MSQKTRHIVVSETNYEALKRLGKMRDSFDEVVTVLLMNASVNAQKGESK